MAVKVAIIGTSNSVMVHGYVIGLAHTPGVEIVANTSLGSSHSILVPLVARDEVLDQSDFAIFDLTINEQRAVDRKMYNLDTMREMFFYILGKCQRHNVIPVFLLMPMRIYEDGYAIIAEYTTLCEQYGVLYFNASPLAKAAAAREGKTWPEVFHDGLHLTTVVAEEVGRHLGEALKAANLSSRGEIAISCREFSFAAAAPFANGLEVFDRATQLISARLVHMAAGDSLTMSVEDDADVVGVSLNMARSNANLCLEGRTRLVKRLTHTNYDLRPKLRQVAWQVLNRVQAEDGRIVLTCLADIDDKAIEPNDHAARKVVDVESPVVELAGLIMRSAAPPTDVLWRAYAHPDLG